MQTNNQTNITTKEIKRLCRLAYKTGGTVPFDLRTMIELGLSLRVINAIIRA